MKKGKDALATPPVLRQFAGLWGLSQQPSRSREWSLEQKVQRAKEAGFEGIGGLFSVEVAAFCQEYEMDFICYVDADLQSYRQKLQRAQSAAAVRVNVQFCSHDTSPKDAAKGWLKLEAFAEELGLLADLEVHRDTCTETPEKVAEIVELYRQATGKPLRLCWDFSHCAVVKHLSAPFADRLLVRPDLVQLARQFHFRPFNGHHGQIPVTNGRGRETPEFQDYMAFVDSVLACWFQGARGGEVVYVCPELGPVSSGYGLSSFPNVWKDTMLLRERTDALWKSFQRKWAATQS